MGGGGGRGGSAGVGASFTTPAGGVGERAGNGGAGGEGGGGGAALRAGDAGSIRTDGLIVGGAGGNGGAGSSAGTSVVTIDPSDVPPSRIGDGGVGALGGTGGRGGAGGVAVQIGDLTGMLSLGSVTGGAGGAGGNGGAGGVGVVFYMDQGAMVGLGGHSGDGGAGGAGGDGGAGVAAGAAAVLTNRSTVNGGAGANGGNGGEGGMGSTLSANGEALVGGSGGQGGRGGAGGAAVVLLGTGATLANEATLQGGAGGAGGTGGANGGGDPATSGQAGVGGAGGAGGAGVMAGAGSRITNGIANPVTAATPDSITGGAGGQGGDAGPDASGQFGATGMGGAGGVGGDGVNLSGQDAALFNGGNIVGGAGGEGGAANGLTAQSPGDGGRGGSGIALANGASAINAGAVSGGIGGRGGAPAVGMSAGQTASGGDGATLSTGAMLTNGGTIVGGTGTFSALGPTEPGSQGGAGVRLDTGATLVNAPGGTITGGLSLTQEGVAGVIVGRGATVNNAGLIAGGASFSFSGAAQGGVGLLATGGGTVNLSGTITGGTDTNGNHPGNAVRMIGGGNMLKLESGYTLNGLAVSQSGGAAAPDILALGGSTDDTFDVNQIGNAFLGFGAYAKRDGNTWSLTGTTSGVTPWSVDAGRLVVSQDASLGATSGALTLNGGAFHVAGTGYTSTSRTLVLGPQGGEINIEAASNTFSVNEAMTGGGGVTKAGQGTLSLAAPNRYTGATRVKEGSLQLTSNASIASSSGVEIAPGALFDIASAGAQTVGALSGGGRVSLGTSTLTSDSALDSVFSGTLDGSGGLTKNGSGLLILNGVNTYTGPTTVNGGTLEVGDLNTPTASLVSEVQVNAAGTLRGHGTIAGNVRNAGTVRPGGSIGTLTINGNFSQSPSGTLAFDVSPSAASQLVVNGTATLAGTLQVLFGPGTYSATSYRLLTANTVVGAFANVVSNVPDGFVLDVASLANGTVASLGAVVIAPTHATLFGAVASAAMRETQRTNEALLARVGSSCNLPVAGRTDCAGPGTAGWVALTGQNARIDGERGIPSYDSRTFGFLAGLETRAGDWTVGVAAGYTHDDVSESTGTKGTIDAVRLAAYGGRWFGPVNVGATAGYAYDFISTTRGFGALGKAQADGNAQEFHAGLQGSLPLPVGPLIVTPRVGARYAYYHGQSLSETGPSSQNLGVSRIDLRSLQPYVGVSLGLPLASPSGRAAMIEARVGYAYETLNAGRDVAVTAADGTGFVIAGILPSRGMLTAGVGAKLPLGKTLDLDVNLDALLGTGNTSAQAARVGLTYRF